MNIETLEDLFGHQLRHAYYVERIHVELLAEMAEETSNADLADRLDAHHEETNAHVDGLEECFDALGRRPRATRSRAADGLAESWNRRQERSDEAAVPSTLEIALTAERFEARAYESLLVLAERLAYAPDVVDPLEATLESEREMETELEALEPDAPVETVGAEEPS